MFYVWSRIPGNLRHSNIETRDSSPCFLPSWQSWDSRVMTICKWRASQTVVLSFLLSSNRSIWNYRRSVVTTSGNSFYLMFLIQSFSLYGFIITCFREIGRFLENQLVITKVDLRFNRNDIVWLVFSLKVSVSLFFSDIFYPTLCRPILVYCSSLGIFFFWNF